LRLCAGARAQLLVNGDAALARATGAGLHLPSARLRELDARPVPPGTLLSASCHDADELALAEALGCDFVLVGPLRATSSHPGQPGMGWGRFEALRERSSLPIYAIGGLSPRDIPVARRHGAQGIAAIRGLWDAPATPAPRRAPAGPPAASPGPAATGRRASPRPAAWGTRRPRRPRGARPPCHRARRGVAASRRRGGCGAPLPASPRKRGAGRMRGVGYVLPPP